MIRLPLPTQPAEYDLVDRLIQHLHDSGSVSFVAALKWLKQDHERLCKLSAAPASADSHTTESRASFDGLGKVATMKRTETPGGEPRPATL